MTIYSLLCFERVRWVYSILLFVRLRAYSSTRPYSRYAIATHILIQSTVYTVADAVSVTNCVTCIFNINKCIYSVFGARKWDRPTKTIKVTPFAMPSTAPGPMGPTTPSVLISDLCLLRFGFTFRFPAARPRAAPRRFPVSMGSLCCCGQESVTAREYEKVALNACHHA